MTTETRLDRRAMFTWLRELKQLDAENAADALWHQAFMDDLRERSDKREARRAEILAGVETLAAEMRVGDSEHVDVPGLARIQFTTRAPALRVADAAAFIAWAQDAERADELLRSHVSLTVDAAAAKAAAEQARQATGELLPGIEEVPAQTSMAVRWKDAK